MARFTVAMQCDNAAFGEEPGAEVARILTELARKVSAGFYHQDTGVLHDENGNTVGVWDWSGEAI